MFPFLFVAGCKVGSSCIIQLAVCHKLYALVHWSRTPWNHTSLWALLALPYLLTLSPNLTATSSTCAVHHTPQYTFLVSGWDVDTAQTLIENLISVAMFVSYPTFSLQLTGHRFFHLWTLFCIAHWSHWAQQILNAYSVNLFVNCGRLSVRKPRIQSESASQSPLEAQHIL